MTGRLIICASPIGNLSDASPALERALEEADIVYAEDTRRSRVLLDHLGVTTATRSYFTGNEHARQGELAARLAEGDTVALLTDAGTPGVSDPGLTAVAAAVETGAQVSVVAGPSAVTAAVAVSGLPADRFVFEGFLPRRAAARADRLADLAGEPRTVVIFSAPRRVAGDLRALADSIGADRRVVVARELTKVHEEVYRGTLGKAATRWTDEVEPRGEFTLVVAGAGPPELDIDSGVAEVGELLADGWSLSDAVKRVSSARSLPRRALYERALLRSRDDA